MPNDRVIEAIKAGTVTIEDLNPVDLRNRFNRAVYQDGRLVLERGRGILDDVDKLDQYLYTYGNMSNKQWQNLTEYNFYIEEKDTTIIDYGCGQGLSLLNLIAKWVPDNEGDTWAKFTRTITLIEPSAIALNRAKAIAEVHFPELEIKTINKCLEDLDEQDLNFEHNPVTIHIFSQILDMPLDESFDVIEFFEKITSSKGLHYILIISHDIAKRASSQNIIKVYKHLVTNYLHEEIELEWGDTDEEGNEIPLKSLRNIFLNNYKIDSGHDSIGVLACLHTK